MRVPYAVGRWVRGRAHYDRNHLVGHLLYAPHTAHWLCGARRMGKTSLLRHLELTADHSAGEYIPLFWDMQGSSTPDELTRELLDAIDVARERLERLGVPADSWVDQDADRILRKLAQSATGCGRTLLLLVDEAEVLAHVAQRHSDWVRRLLGAMTDAGTRTVLAATKWLAHTEDVAGDRAGDRVNKGLLREFQPVFLSRLDEVAARALVRQEQSDGVVVVEDGTVDDIVVHTNGHPYLLQYLCQRLFEADGAGQGRLRPVRDMDLEPDALLAALFANDFRYLTATEQRLMLSMAGRRVARLREIAGDVNDVDPETVALYLYGLDRLGFLRRVFGQWAVGNEYLQRWLTAESEALAQTVRPTGDETAQRWLTESARQSEMQFYREELAEAEAELQQLEAGELSLISEGMRLTVERSALLRRRIARLKRDLGEIALPTVF